MAGTVTITTTVYSDARIVKYALAWVSDSAGDVNGHTAELSALRLGYLKQIKFVPNTTDQPPLDLYDVQLVDGDGIDLLIGAGLNRSNTLSTYVLPTAQIFRDAASTLDLVVTNAASGIEMAAGTVNLWFRL